MQTYKIDAPLIALLAAMTLLHGCGEEQKETAQKSESAVTESKPEESVAKPEAKTMEGTEKADEAQKRMTEPVVEKATESMEKTAEAVSSAADQTLQKATEASQELITKAETTTTEAVETVKQMSSDDQEVVKTTPEQVRKIQQALQDAGFNPGPVDGILGPKTLSALENFQKHKGLTVGQTTKETLRALGVIE